MSDRKLLVLMTAEQADTFARLVAVAEHGDGDAACRLGDMYREGQGGVRYSPKQTYRWYAKSALAGDADGQNNLGACYEHALGCAQSYAKAVKWYRRSVAQGVSTAYMNLGYCYLRGHGVPADYEEALRLFREAAARGEKRAADELERLGEAPGLRAHQPATPNPCSGASRPEHSPADTQQVRPCSSHGFPTRDGPPENLGAVDVVSRIRCTTAEKTDQVPIGPSESDADASTSTKNANREPETSKVQIVRGIRFVDETQPGRHIGLVGIGGVESAPPGFDVHAAGDAGTGGPLEDRLEAGAESEHPRTDSLRVRGGALRHLHTPPPWEDEDVRRELLEIMNTDLATPVDGANGPSEVELLPIFAEGGLKPGDLVEGIAERYAEYLKQQPSD